MSDPEMALRKEGRRAGTQASRSPSFEHSVFHPPLVHPESLPAAIWHDVVTQRPPSPRPHLVEKGGETLSSPTRGFSSTNQKRELG